jgi:hypothetical protein
MNKGSATRGGSPGHQLVFELLRLLKEGKPLSPESEAIWQSALTRLLIAGNQEQGAKRFFERLGLTYRTGAPPNDAERTVYRVEVLKLAGKTKAGAFIEIAESTGRDDTTIRDTYYDYRKNRPNQHNAIRILAKSEYESGNGTSIPVFLGLYLATHNQDL